VKRIGAASAELFPARIALPDGFRVSLLTGRTG